MSTLTAAVGKRIRTRRKELDYSQEELAERAGLHATYIGQLERGEKNATLETLERVCTALSLSFSGLFSGLGPAPEEWDADLSRYRSLWDRLDKWERRHVLNILSEVEDLLDKE